MSRELDRLVAEKVMGWTDVRDDYFRIPESIWYGRPPVMPAWESTQHKNMGISLLPHYSTRIEDAWLVVGYLHGHGLLCGIDGHTYANDGQWYVEFADADYDIGGQATEDTVPMAICVAALAALEAKAICK